MGPFLMSGTNDAIGTLRGMAFSIQQLLIDNQVAGSLSTRKQSIESELARIEELRGEQEALTAQVAALDQAMKAFQDQPARHPGTA